MTDSETIYIPISEIVTELSRQRIFQLATEGKVRAEKRNIGNVTLWFVSQEDVTNWEQSMEEMGNSKYGMRYPEPEQAQS